MVFSSTVFLFLFLPLALLIYYNPWIRSRGFRNGFLLLASLCFYAWGEPVFVFLMIASILLTWGLGLGVAAGKKHRKLFLRIGIVFHVGLLFTFKYLSFFLKQLGLLLGSPLPAPEIALPIGISFFTFQLMSYLFDVYYKKASVQRNPLYVGLYIALFPQLIAGPIVRYGQIAEEISRRKDDFEGVVLGMKRFIYGLAKKVLIANYVAQIADNTFDYLTQMPAAMAWLGAICYTLQIYFDFSGYSDMAIGLGRMFGFHFAENFNYPYISRSITEFWRRWHISLSTWFRDYVYIPLGGSRVGRKRRIFNLLVVWLLTGIWHGANWTFLCWGLLYFALLLLERWAGAAEEGKPRSWFGSAVSWGYTSLAVVIAWVIFRASDLGAAARYLGIMFGIGAEGWSSPAVTLYLRSTWPVLAAALVGATPLCRKALEWLREKRLGWLEPLWLLLLFGISALRVISSTYNPFIYFNF